VERIPLSLSRHAIPFSRTLLSAVFSAVLSLAAMPTPREAFILPLTLNPAFGGSGHKTCVCVCVCVCVSQPFFSGTSIHIMANKKTVEELQQLQQKGNFFLGLALKKDLNSDLEVQFTTFARAF